MAYIAVILAFALGYLLAYKRREGQIDPIKLNLPKFPAQKKIVQLPMYEPKTTAQETLEELEHNKTKVKVFYAR